MANERRVKSRYPLELNVRYQTLEPSGLVAGVGQTVNLSSNGLHLACASEISEGTRIKIFIEWPSLLNGTTPLQLITVGTVVRRTPVGISITFESYQFRTMGRTRPAPVADMPQSSSYGETQVPTLAYLAKSN